MGHDLARGSGRHALAGLATAAILLAPVLSANASAQARPAESSASSGEGNVTFALPPNAAPDWIFPIATPGHLASYNFAVQDELFVPLYNYDTSSGTFALDESVSAADKPVYSNGDKTVTITLQKLQWSNGQPVTSRDVQFWYDLVKANKAQWGNYSAGEMPDDIAKFTVLSPSTFRLQLTKAYNPGWFTANQLTLLSPLPQGAWDRESANQPVGNYDLTTSGAKKVFSYLVSAAGHLASYSTDPLWQVTDGPFQLKTFTTSGDVVLVKNTDYHGPEPARLASVTLEPFTSDEAEFNALRSGEVDYGYLPTTDIPEVPTIKADGYDIVPWVGWAITYIPYNFNNPSMGPVFKQLYVRQAVQSAINQKTIANVIWHGYATVDYGPVPQTPPSPYLSKVQQDNPYPADLKKARSLLTSHGWSMGHGSVLECTSPGAGPGHCGPGIAKGKKLAFTILSESGSTETNNMMEYLQSSLSTIGIGLSIKYEPLNNVLDQSAECKPTQASCSWQASFFGTQGSWYFPAYPSGEQIFLTDAGVNLGSYSNPTADKLIDETNVSASTVAMQDYSAFLAKNLPVIWVPNPDYQVSAIRSTLHGVLQNPGASFMQLQHWYLSKTS